MFRCIFGKYYLPLKAACYGNKNYIILNTQYILSNLIRHAYVKYYVILKLYELY